MSDVNVFVDNDNGKIYYAEYLNDEGCKGCAFRADHVGTGYPSRCVKSPSCSTSTRQDGRQIVWKELDPTTTMLLGKAEDDEKDEEATQFISHIYAVAHCKVPKYLTKNKRYLVGENSDGLFTIVDDDGDTIICRWEGCSHLYGKDWGWVRH